ncbi:hypothetical protein YC2023_115366 [Brassica napus]
MENYHELVSSTRVMLDGSNYGLWKSRMRSIIRGIDAMAWKSELCQTVVQIGKENLCLKKDKRWLKDTVINLRKELNDERKKEASTSDLKKENVRLDVHIKLLEKQVKDEKARSSDLNAKLEHHYKTVIMLTGSKELGKILSLGRQYRTSRGLGYTGYGESDTEPIKFVPSSNFTGENNN